MRWNPIFPIEKRDGKWGVVVPDDHHIPAELGTKTDAQWLADQITSRFIEHAEYENKTRGGKLTNMHGRVLEVPD